MHIVYSTKINPNVLELPTQRRFRLRFGLPPPESQPLLFALLFDAEETWVV